MKFLVVLSVAVAAVAGQHVYPIGGGVPIAGGLSYPGGVSYSGGVPVHTAGVVPVTAGGVPVVHSVVPYGAYQTLPVGATYPYYSVVPKTYITGATHDITGHKIPTQVEDTAEVKHAKQVFANEYAKAVSRVRREAYPLHAGFNPYPYAA